MKARFEKVVGMNSVLEVVVTDDFKYKIKLTTNGVNMSDYIIKGNSMGCGDSKVENGYVVNVLDEILRKHIEDFINTIKVHFDMIAEECIRLAINGSNGEFREEDF